MMTTCPRCLGRGYLTQPPDRDGPADERECWECEGSGSVPADAEAARIDGLAALAAMHDLEVA